MNLQNWSDITPKNVKAYIQGNLRMFFYYNPILRFLLPLHIYEQINYRLFVMDKECYTNGACLKCGCATPALQMADKKCLGDCYPEMMDASKWTNHKKYNKIDFRYTDLKKREFDLRITKTTN